MKQETRGRKPYLPQTIDVWYKNEFRKLQYRLETEKISEKEFEIKKKELNIEKNQREILEIENQKVYK